MKSSTHKSRALDRAAEMAVASLRGVDLPRRCEMLGLDPPDAENQLEVRMFGRSVVVKLPECIGESLHPADRLLLLHYLGCEREVTPEGKWIAFRKFPGGAFYRTPFENHTSVPLIDAIGDDVGLLRRRMEDLDARPIPGGDLAAAVRAFGRVELAIVYHRSDDEFPASATILFDASLRRVFCAEDASALAGRLVQKLTHQPCAACSGCGMCDG